MRPMADLDGAEPAPAPLWVTDRRRHGTLLHYDNDIAMYKQVKATHQSFISLFEDVLQRRHQVTMLK